MDCGRPLGIVGRPCRHTPIKEVAEELFLDWHAVKELDKQYMREQLRRAGTRAPRVIGIDEIAIAKGHKYRIVVSDLERGRPLFQEVPHTVRRRGVDRRACQCAAARERGSFRMGAGRQGG